MTKRQPSPQVGIVMGSQSDWPTMRRASEMLDELGVPHEVKIVSAHRTPDRLFAYAADASAPISALNDSSPSSRAFTRRS